MSAISPPFKEVTSDLEGTFAFVFSRELPSSFCLLSNDQTATIPSGDSVL